MSALFVTDAVLDGERVGLRCAADGMIAPHAQLVGMTIASECVVAGELGLEYAAICVVDNLANGLGDGELSIDEMEADRLINATRLRDGLAAVLPRLGAVGR